MDQRLLNLDSPSRAGLHSGIIDDGIVPSGLRARLTAPEGPSSKKEIGQKQLLADVYSKGRRRVFELLLAEGGCVPAVEFGKLLGLDKQEVEEMGAGAQSYELNVHQVRSSIPCGRLSRESCFMACKKL
jgi:hypothetical protein